MYERRGGGTANKVQTKFNLDRPGPELLARLLAGGLGDGVSDLFGRTGCERKDFVNYLGRGDEQAVQEAKANVGMPNAGQTVFHSRSGVR